MIADAFLSCPIWAFYTLAAWAVGCLLLRFFPSVSGDKLAHAGLALALGMGFLGTLWSALSLVPHGMQPATVIAALSLSLLCGGRSLMTCFSALDFKALIPREKKLKWVIAPLIAFLLLTPLMTWFPLGTDAISFYFAQAKLIAYAQGFQPLPGYEAFAQIALPAELTYSALLLLGPDLAARLITATELLACVLLIAALAGACGLGIFGRWMAVLLLLTSTSVTLLISDGKTDLYGAMLGLATLYTFVASPDLSKRSLLLMGLLTGFAVAGKLTYLPIFIPMLGGLLFWRCAQFSRSLSGRLREFFIGSTLISVGVIFNLGLMMIKNYVFYHEPFAPFFFLDETNSAGLTRQVWFSPEVTRWILMTYPAVWLFGQYPMQHGVISPLLLGALPAFSFVKWKDINWRQDRALALAAAGFLGLALWAVVYPSVIAPRYIFPVFFALMPLAARGLETLWHSFGVNGKRQLIFAILLGCFSLMPLVCGWSDAKNGLRWVTRGPDESYGNEIWSGLRSGEVELGESDRLLLIGWERSPLQGKTLSCLVGQNEIGIDDIVSGKTNAKKYWEDIYKVGTKALVVNRVGRADFASRIDVINKPDWLEIEEKQINGYYTVYVLTATAGAPAREKKCTQGPDGLWKTTLTTTDRHE